MCESTQHIPGQGDFKFFVSRHNGRKKRFYYGQVRSREEAERRALHYEATGKIIRDKKPPRMNRVSSGRGDQKKTHLLCLLQQ